MATDDFYRIVVGSTDPDWFRFLRSHAEVQEVNFWRPGVTSMRTAKGAPWLFLLRGTNEIWGCAFFAAFSLMPIGVAWETFGRQTAMKILGHCIKKISRLKGTAESAVGSIGCAVLSNPEYFDTPINYASVGRMYGPIKSFDARSAQGAQLRTEIAARLQRQPEASAIIGGGVGKPVLVVPRLGQAAFRIELEKQYQTRCAVTGERTRPVLDAAHIKQFSIVKEHALPNGLLLRKDIHRLFDDGYVTVLTGALV